MNLFLTLAFLFCIGSVLGWGLEVIFRRFFSAAISAISRANFSLHAASVWTETLVPFVSRSLSGSREAGTLQFPEKPLVQGLHVVVHTCRLPCSATQHTTETGNSQGHGALLSNCYHLGAQFQLSVPAGYQIPRAFCCLQCRNF